MLEKNAGLDDPFSPEEPTEVVVSLILESISYYSSFRSMLTDLARRGAIGDGLLVKYLQNVMVRQLCLLSWIFKDLCEELSESNGKSEASCFAATAKASEKALKDRLDSLRRAGGWQCKSRQQCVSCRQAYLFVFIGEIFIDLYQ